jgi:hypothetical protein
VTLPQVESWLEHLDEREEPADPPAGLAELTRTRIEGWNDLGRTLCGSFVDVAERVAVAA